jgi:signal transduction histidine kinase
MLKGIEGPLTELQAKDLAIIRQNGQQLSQLLNDIHELANLEVGTIELNKTSVDIAYLIQDMESNLSLTMHALPLRVDLQTEPALPVILADADRLRQVLTNLIITATGISPGETITLNAKHLDEQVHFVVSAPAARETAESHSDIHLALSRRLIELHGGRLRVAEHANGDMVFAFSLPINPKGSLESNGLRQPIPVNGSQG